MECFRCKPGKELFWKSGSSRSLKAKEGCPMTLLETLALLTLIVTVVCETINITLKVLQYIESKQNKKD